MEFIIYIIEILKKKGFETKFINPNKVFISWIQKKEKTKPKDFALCVAESKR